MKREEVITWTERIMEFSLCAIVFTLPFSKAAMGIFFAFALTSWIVNRSIKCHYVLSAKCYSLKGIVDAFRPVKTELNLPIVVFVFSGFLSTLITVSLPLSLEGFFFKLLKGIMLYFIIVETICNNKRLNRILIVLLSSMILLGIDGIVQFITGVDFIRHYSIHVYRVRGSFGNPNGFAAWLIVMISIALSIAYFWKNDWINFEGKHSWLKKTIKPILWILMGILIVCLVLTYTRGAWIATLLAIIFFGININKKWLLLTLIVLLILSFVVPGRVKKRAVVIFYPSPHDEGVKNARIKLWQEALSIIRDFPLLGCGLNTYTAVIPAYKKTMYTGFYPHNSYLQMAAESGILGLGAFIWIMVTLFKTSLASFKKMSDTLRRALLLGILAGLFGFLAHSFIDVNIYALQLVSLMWLVVGLSVAIQRIATEKRE